MSYVWAFTIAILTIAISAVDGREISHITLGKRAESEYAPRLVPCPSLLPTVRSAAELSTNETLWLQTRRNNTVPALKDFLNRANISGFDVNKYFEDISTDNSNFPNIGIAVSGGGYRALMVGAGALAAFDNRTANSTAQGQLGGLLQAATYLSALSGGSWLVGSLYMQNFASVQDIVTGPSSGLGSLWQFENSILQGPNNTSITDYYGTLVDDVNAKQDAGFNTSFTDYWGRSLSYQLFNASTGSPGFVFSSVANGSHEFSTGNAPMPLIVAVEREPNELVILSNTTIFEFNPWEFGTYDPTSYGYAPLQFIGSNFSGGVLPQQASCTVGFDNIGFVVGTSSSLFNQFYLQINTTNLGPRVQSAFSNLLSQWGSANNDISLWPNPFFGYNKNSNPNAQNKVLTLVDGGEDLENIPFHPLLCSTRQVDVIFAVDSSADTDMRWPNGTPMVATYNRSLIQNDGNSSSFPVVPDQNTFLNLGLNSRPTFFGCNPGNQSKPGPLVVYLPNAPYTYYANVSTYDLSYNVSERDAIIRNGYNMVTKANSTLDPQWPSCVGCAILARSFNRTGTALPDTCKQCFSRYCWDGTINSTIPSTYDPTLLVHTSGSARLFAWPSLLEMCLGFMVLTHFIM